MRALIAVALIAGIPAAVQAEPASCRQYAELAEEIMRSHQLAIPLEDMLEIMSSEEGRRYVIRTYRTPRYADQESQQAAIAEARDSMAASCHEVRAE